MSAEVISIGAELVCGANLDTNSQWLSRELEALGWTVSRHTSLADDLEQIVSEFRAAAERSQVVIVTGGLGPTLDDLTRDALAAAVGQRLVTDQHSLQQIQNLFAARGREMPERNQRQALRPEFAEALPNSCGTAPGILLKVPRHATPGRSFGECLIVVLPGVPAEMKPMFDLQVRPHLQHSAFFIDRSVIRTFGFGESDAERLLGDLTARGRNPEVGITASEAVISLWITARSGSPEDSRRMSDVIRAQIYERLGNAVYGEGDVLLHDVVARRLQQAGCRVALREESTTGGLIACWLTENLRNAACLVSAQVLPPTASAGTTGSPDWAEEARISATTILNQHSADFVLLSSTHAEVLSDSGVGMKRGHVAVAGRGIFELHDVSISGNLAIFRQRAARTALNRLRLILESAMPNERSSLNPGH